MSCYQYALTAIPQTNLSIGSDYPVLNLINKVTSKISRLSWQVSMAMLNLIAGSLKVIPDWLTFSQCQSISPPKTAGSEG